MRYKIPVNKIVTLFYKKCAVLSTTKLMESKNRTSGGRYCCTKREIAFLFRKITIKLTEVIF